MKHVMKKRVMSLLLVAMMLFGLMPAELAVAAPAANRSLTVSVLDSSTNLPLRNVTFTLEDSNGQAKSSLTTDSTGKVNFPNLTDGIYTVRANAPAGYMMLSNSQTIQLAGQGNAEIQFRCASSPSIRLTAVDANGSGVKDVVFEIAKMSDPDKKMTITTGEDGVAVASGLENTYYTIKQITAPTGFIKDTTVMTIKPAPGQVTPASWIMSTETFVKITATLNGSVEGLYGVTITLIDVSGNRVASGTTDKTGTVTFQVPAGRYTVESTAPDGYYVSLNTTSIDVPADGSTNVNLQTGRASSIVIKKQDKNTKVPLAGAVFEIRNNKGMTVEVITTDETGTAISQTLPAGNYVIGELYAPAGYVPDYENYIAEIVDTNPCIVTLTNSSKSAVVITSMDGSGAGLSGTKYNIYSAFSGALLKTVEVNEFGVAVINDLAPGTYFVSEISAPDGWNLKSQNPQYVTVFSDRASHLQFHHNFKGSIQIQTADAVTGKFIPGGSYAIYKADGTYIGDFDADENGLVTTGVMEDGRYTVRQTIAPLGYKKATNVVTVDVTSATIGNAKFFNEKLSGIMIESVDQATHTPLAHTTFEIWNSDAKMIFHGTTDGSGILRTDELPAGVYTVKQMATRQGWEIITHVKTVTVTSNEYSSVVFENKALTGMTIQLVDGETQLPLANGRFKVQQKNGDFVKEVTTDAYGFATIIDLPVGTYMVTETNAPQNYILPGDYQWAEVVFGAHTDVKFVNYIHSSLTIHSVVRDSHGYLAGAIYEIYEKNGKLIMELTSDASGWATTDKLAPGTYLVKEVHVPDHYSVDMATREAVITYGRNTTVVFNHMPEAALTIKKVDTVTGAALAGAEFRVEKANGDFIGNYTTDSEGLIVLEKLPAGFYTVTETRAPEGYFLDRTPHTVEVKTSTPVYITIQNNRNADFKIIKTVKQTGKPLAGVTFKIRTEKGAYIGDYTTNEAGIITVHLEPGKYVVAETYAPKGYKMDPTPHNIVIKPNEQTILEVQNEELTTVKIHKIDSVTKKGIYGVQFEITDAYNNYIGRYTTDNEGYIELTDVLQPGRYFVKEIRAAAGYSLDPIPRTLHVESGKACEMVWENVMQAGQLTINKFSADDNAALNLRAGSKLPGAEFTIYDSNNNVVEKIVTGPNGQAKSSKLPVGHYTVVETNPPAGYQLNPTPAPFNIKGENDNIVLNVYNKTAKLGVTVNKQGTPYVYAGGLTKYSFTDVKNTSSSPLTNFFLRDELPQGATAVTLHTGTWSADLNYSIQYQTNKNPNWRNAMTNMNTRSQRTVRLDANSLHLAKDEKVTAVQFMFGQVPAGFHEMMAPVLTVHAENYLPNGYQLLNTATAGGYAGTQLQQAWSEWTTVVMNPVCYPNHLPKTGY